MSKSSCSRGSGFLILLVILSMLFGYQLALAAPKALASPTVPTWVKSTLKFIRFDSRKNSVEVTQDNMQVFYQVLDKINEEYINPDVDPQKVIYGAASGAVSSLGDPYSRFVAPDPGKEMQKDIEGLYSGVGISIEERQGFTVIMNVFPESPAEQAGLMSGDVISSVDGVEVLESGSLKIVDLIRGEEGTDVKIGVRRNGSDEETVYTMKRSDIKYPSVWKSEMLEGDIGYVEITQFNKETATDLRADLDQLVADGAKGIILDLRNNPGGPLEAAVYVSDMFLPKCDVVYLKGRDGELIADPVDPEGRDGDKNIGLPLVVLINQYSASASEIVAGAIQDYGAGTIMGQTSFGKGVVQNVIPLFDGSYLVITTNKYLTPKQRDINEVGIKPDVEISLEPDKIKDEHISGLLREMEALTADYTKKNEELRDYIRDHDYQLDIARDFLADEINGKVE